MADHDVADRLDVLDTLHRMAWYQDRRQWDRFDEVLADGIDTEYVNVSDGPQHLDRAALVASWRADLDRMHVSQHLLTGVIAEIDGDRATATCNETVWLARDTEMGGHLLNFGTHMDIGLARTSAGWRIDRLTVVPGWSEGNASVLGQFVAPAARRETRT